MAIQTNDNGYYVARCFACGKTFHEVKPIVNSEFKKICPRCRAVNTVKVTAPDEVQVTVHFDKTPQK